MNRILHWTLCFAWSFLLGLGALANSSFLQIPNPTHADRFHPSLVQTAKGEWIVIWSESFQKRAEIKLAKTSDQGKTWSPIQTLVHENQESFSPQSDPAQLEIDAHGNLSVAWKSRGSIRMIQSVDGGKYFKSPHRAGSSMIGKAKSFELSVRPEGEAFLAWIGSKTRSTKKEEPAHIYFSSKTLSASEFSYEKLLTGSLPQGVCAENRVSLHSNRHGVVVIGFRNDTSTARVISFLISKDGGKTFSTPIPVFSLDQSADKGFKPCQGGALAYSPQVWIDDRNRLSFSWIAPQENGGQIQLALRDSEGRPLAGEPFQSLNSIPKKLNLEVPVRLAFSDQVTVAWAEKTQGPHGEALIFYPSPKDALSQPIEIKEKNQILDFAFHFGMSKKLGIAWTKKFENHSEVFLYF